jgi:hypothetical protein
MRESSHSPEKSHQMEKNPLVFSYDFTHGVSKHKKPNRSTAVP